jgi:1,4-alpha-glucan branching enzyme
MNHLEQNYHLMSSHHQFVSLSHEQDKVIVFEKGNLLFVFNFHPTKSFTNYKVGT